MKANPRLTSLHTQILRFAPVIDKDFKIYITFMPTIFSNEISNNYSISKNTQVKSPYCSQVVFFIVLSSKTKDPFKVFFFKKINLYILFIYFWLCWVFVAAHGLSLIEVSGAYSSLRCAGFSSRWLLVAEHGL